MFDKKIPTKLHLHLALTTYGDSYTIFTGETPHTSMKEYPYICSIDVVWPVTNEDIQAQYADMKLGALYKELGEIQGKLDAKKEEIAKLLCIGHEPVKVEAEWLPPEAPHTAGLTAGPDGRIVVNPPFDAFDDDIPF